MGTGWKICTVPYQTKTAKAVVKGFTNEIINEFEPSPGFILSSFSSLFVFI